MMESLKTLIQSLREELQQYGELLALLDQQQELIVARAAEDLFHLVAAIQTQASVIQAARDFREECRREVARQVPLDENVPFAELVQHLPDDYRPLLKALVQENNELLVRVQQRTRQNHLLLSRSLELMQQFLSTLAPSRDMGIYTHRGTAPVLPSAPQPLYEAVG